MTGQLGVIYMLCFTPALPARPPLRRLDRRPARPARHRTPAGHGARLIAVITQAGIGFTLVRICEGTRRRERAIKNAGGAVRYCPACTPHPRNGRWGPLPADLIPRTYPDPAGRR